MDDRSRKTAEHFSILNRVKKLEAELLNVRGVVNVEFDLNGFYDNLNQVIFLVKYDLSQKQGIAAEEYWKARTQLLIDVVSVAANNGLKRTEDRIEDYGEHFYFVTSCKNGWK